MDTIGTIDIKARIWPFGAFFKRQTGGGAVSVNTEGNRKEGVGPFALFLAEQYRENSYGRCRGTVKRWTGFVSAGRK